MPERNGVARRPLVALEALTSFVALAARYRAWHLAWGATGAEASGPMPGDDLLEKTLSRDQIPLNRRSPHRVWPWLVQVGFGRAGFYSYDLLDNLAHPQHRRGPLRVSVPLGRGPGCPDDCVRR